MFVSVCSFSSFLAKQYDDVKDEGIVAPSEGGIRLKFSDHFFATAIRVYGLT